MSDRLVKVYERKLNYLINKRKKELEEQDQADYDAYMKRQENRGKLNTAFSLYNNITKARMVTPTLKIQDLYKDDATAKKYEMREGGEFGQLNPLRLLPGGEKFQPGQYFEERGVKGFGEEIGKEVKQFVSPIQETEGYKEFQVLEDLKTSKSGVVPESLVGAIDPETGKQITGKGYDTLIKSRGIESDLAKMGLANVDDAILKKHGLTKESARDLVNILEEKGITLKEGVLDQEQTVKLLSAYKKTVNQQLSLRGRLGEGEMLPSEAFEKALKQTGQNPDMLPTVVTDLTENTDKTLKAVNRGTYTPGQEPTGKLTYDEWMTSEDPDGDLQINPYSGNITEKTIGERYAMDELGAGSDLKQTPLSDADVSGYYAEETASTLDKLEIESGEVGRVPTETIPKYSQRQLKKIEVSKDLALDELEAEKLQQLRDIQTTPGVTPEASSDPDLEKALKDLENLKAPKVRGSDEVLPGQLRVSVGMSDMPDVEAPIIPGVEIPDAKPGFMSKGFGAAKELGTMENIQNAYGLWNVGQTIGNKDATNEERGVATVQATKMLADLAAKKAGQKTAVEAVKAGTKIGGKAAVGAAAGGVLGGYTMVTEGKEAAESWEEGDYDEAILHGMGSISGGLQTAGAGMMLSGVGAPLGAILYTVGTAGSVISSVGGFIEGLFDKEEAPGQPKKPKANLRQYYRGIMDRDARSDYLRYGR